MLRLCAKLAIICLVFSAVCWACSCANFERPCELLSHDVAFVGRVVETTPIKRTTDKFSYTVGYSMRFSVEESLRGELGTEAIVETGSGGGDCGTPLDPGGRYLIFAYKNEKGKLGTGVCSGNQHLEGGPEDEQVLQYFRAVVKKGGGTIFGRVLRAWPVWQDDDVQDAGQAEPVPGLVVRANRENFSTATITAKDGSFEFDGLPNGKYSVVPEIGQRWEFSREYAEEWYGADLKDGQCKHVSFKLQPATRIRGHVAWPPGMESRSIEVVAIPTHLRKLNQFSGKWNFTDENDRFDLWPLPPGDYFVGININSSPKPDAPFPPTYYPGVTSRDAASIVHVGQGEARELELPLREVAEPRRVDFVAIGLDGKPMRKIYIQLEDLRHPGDTASYVNVDLDALGRGMLTVYAGYSYHLHGSQSDQCSKPVVITAGTRSVRVRFVMDRKDSYCHIADVDGLRK